MSEGVAEAKTRHAGDLSEAASEWDAPTGRNIIVCIGINEYRYWKPLDNAVTDAIGVHDLLVRRMGFESPLLPLLNEFATRKAISDLITVELPCKLEAGDSLVLFFAGHGHTRVTEENGQRVERGCLIPVEAGTDQPDDYLPLDEFLQNVSHLAAHRILVILDACRSGMALGLDVILKASSVRSGGAPISNRCRRVISSARWDQDARDSGPVEDHSLFTGCLVQGLDWGTADLLEDGTISATELGLFVRKYVDQESKCRQTPDFGVFEAGAQGDLLFSLRENTSQAIKTRAYAALQRGRFGEFAGRTAQLAGREEESPWVSFLFYRKALLEGEVKAAREYISRLRGKYLTRGAIPLSKSDVVSLEVQLEYFGELLAVPEASYFPLEVRLQLGPDDPKVWKDPDVELLGPLLECTSEALGDVSGLEIPQGSVARFWGKNKGCDTVHIYFAAVRPDGRLVFGPLLHDPSLAVAGLGPWAEAWGAPFKVANVGLTETRLFCSPSAIPTLLRPPSTATRYLEPPHVTDLPDLTRHSVWYRVSPPKQSTPQEDAP